MKLCDRMAPGEDADQLARLTLDTVLMGLRAGAAVGITSDVPDCTYTDSEDRQS